MNASHRPIVALAAAEAISLSGTRLSMIAIPWLVLILTGDPLLTGLVGFAELLPYVIAKALGGPLIDRLGGRRIAVAGDALSMVVIALVPLLQMTGLLSVATILPTVAALGALRGPADAAKYAMIPTITSAAGVPLERITGLMGVIERLASTVGAAAAGALVALVGPAPALAATAAAFALSALTVLFALRVQTASPQRQAAPYLADLREGWRWFSRDAVLVGLVIMVATTNLFDAAYTGVLVPVWADAHGDAALLGLMFAIFSGASIAGSALATALGERLPRLPVYVIAYLITGMPRYLILSMVSPMLAVMIVLAIAGFTSGFLNPILGAVMFERIPKALTGRVTALVNALCWTLMPLGGLLGGLLITRFGLSAAFAMIGVAYLATTLLPLAVPSFRGFAQRPQSAPAE